VLVRRHFPEGGLHRPRGGPAVGGDGHQLDQVVLEPGSRGAVGERIGTVPQAERADPVGLARRGGQGDHRAAAQADHVRAGHAVVVHDGEQIGGLRPGVDVVVAGQPWRVHSPRISARKSLLLVGGLRADTVARYQRLGPVSVGPALTR
jgi:hypothetical protein